LLDECVEEGTITTQDLNTAIRKRYLRREVTRQTQMRPVRLETYGDVDVLEVVAVPNRVPGQGEVLVRVKAAGINPGETVIRTGMVHDIWPATFPLR